MGVKSHPADLAVFSGPPAFERELHVGRPNVGDRQRLLERINDLLDRGWLTNDGPYVREFERRLADTVGAEHCIATCNGTVALEIAIRAAGLTGEVIIPSFTFVATAHALQWQGITPVFCDSAGHTQNIDPLQVERMITPRTTGIVGVHVWGHPCDIEALSEIAHNHELRLLFDAAHAFGCSYKGRLIGNFGDAEVFSFHATKVLNTFEGGALVTADEELAHKARMMRNFGFVDYDKVVYLGTNGKMSEVAAAMGLTSLEDLADFITVNYQNYKQYERDLVDIPGIRLFTYDETEKRNYQYVILDIDEEVAHLDRDDLHRVLWAEKVLARRYFYPGCHRMEPYRSYFPHAGAWLPNTEQLSGRVLSLPTGTGITADQIAEICRIIRLAAAHGPEVREKLKWSNSTELPNP